MKYLSLLIAPFLALCYRGRGGFMGLGSTTLARLLWWALPNTIVTVGLLLAHGMGWTSVLFGLVTGVFSFIAVLSKHGPYMDNNPPLEDSLQMAQIGFMRSAAPAMVLCTVSPWYLLVPLFGAMSGLSYYIGWTFLHNVDSGITALGSVFAKGGSEWGEVLTGFFFGLGLSVCFLLAT